MDTKYKNKFEICPFCGGLDSKHCSVCHGRTIYLSDAAVNAVVANRKEEIRIIRKNIRGQAKARETFASMGIIK